VRLFFAFHSLEEHNRVGPKFVNNLPAGPTRGAGNSVIIDDRDGTNSQFRPELRDCGKNCRTLSAVRHSVRSIFDIAPREDLASVGQYGGADSKAGVRCIGFLHGRSSRSQQPRAVFLGSFSFCHRFENYKLQKGVELARLIVNRESRLLYSFLKEDRGKKGLQILEQG